MPNGSLSPATSSPGRRIRLGREFLFHGILFLERESFWTVLRDFLNIFFFFSYDVFMVFVTCIPVDLGKRRTFHQMEFIPYSWMNIGNEYETNDCFLWRKTKNESLNYRFCRLYRFSCSSIFLFNYDYSYHQTEGTHDRRLSHLCPSPSYRFPFSSRINRITRQTLDQTSPIYKLKITNE